MIQTLTGDALARRVAEAMYARDNAAQDMGMELHEAREGFSRVSMRIQERMLNGHGIAHGGVIFALGDTAFAYACNSRNRPNVALQCSVSFTTPARVGEDIVAVAEERSSGSRTSAYDVTLTCGDRIVALFRGVAYGVRGSVVED